MSKCHILQVYSDWDFISTYASIGSKIVRMTEDTMDLESPVRRKTLRKSKKMSLPEKWNPPKGKFEQATSYWDVTSANGFLSKNRASFMFYILHPRSWQEDMAPRRIHKKNKQEARLATWISLWLTQGSCIDPYDNTSLHGTPCVLLGAGKTRTVGAIILLNAHEWDKIMCTRLNENKRDIIEFSHIKANCVLLFKSWLIGNAISCRDDLFVCMHCAYCGEHFIFLPSEGTKSTRSRQEEAKMASRELHIKSSISFFLQFAHGSIRILASVDEIVENCDPIWLQVTFWM